MTRRRTFLLAAAGLSMSAPALAADWSTRKAEVEGVSLAYSEWPGAGPPIVFLHGLSSSRQAWEPVLALRGAHQAYAYDARGHGESGRSPGRYTFVQQGRDVVGFIETVVKRPAILVGHSLGAMVAIWAGANRPDLVAAAVLEDPPLYTGERGPGGNEAQFRPGRERSGRTVDAYMAAGSSRAQAEALARLDPVVYDQVLDDTAFTGWRTDPLLDKLMVPTLICRADVAKGSAIRAGELERALSHLAKNRRLEVAEFPGAPHRLHGDQPQKFVEVVQAWLAKTAPPKPA